MRYDKSSTRNTVTVIRLKADNYNCYVSPEAYKAITLEMSSGDYGAHKHRAVEVSPDTLQNIMFHHGPGYVDIAEHGEEPILCWWFYDAAGDCLIEPVA